MGALTAMDFGLLDFATGQTDFTKHPNFNSGQMEFGLANDFSVDIDSLPPAPFVKLCCQVINSAIAHGSGGHWPRVLR